MNTKFKVNGTLRITNGEFEAIGRTGAFSDPARIIRGRILVEINRMMNEIKNRKYLVVLKDKVKITKYADTEANSIIYTICIPVRYSLWLDIKNDLKEIFGKFTHPLVNFCKTVSKFIKFLVTK